MFKYLLIFFISVFLQVILISSTTIKESSCIEYDKVNVFIGTGGYAYGYGGINPGAQLPFSPLRLGPDTSETIVDLSYRHFSGYNYNDTLIRGFSHTHLVGAGVNDLGNFGILPTVLSTTTSSSNIDSSNKLSPWWWTTFNKSSESASPGRYSVELTNPDIHVDLLAIGSFAGLHRYTWNNVNSDYNNAIDRSSSAPALIIDICHAAKLETDIISSNPCLMANISINESKQSFSGSVYFSGSLSGNTWVHIYGEIASTSSAYTVKSWETCTEMSDIIGHKSTCSNNNQVSSNSGSLFSIVTIEQSTTAQVTQEDVVAVELEVLIGISYIDTDTAKANLYSAIEETSDFEKLFHRTKGIWCELLNEFTLLNEPVSITSSTNNNNDNNNNMDITSMIHSAHYRTLLSPTIYTESTGLYLGLDNMIHNSSAERCVYTNTCESQHSPHTNNNTKTTTNDKKSNSYSLPFHNYNKVSDLFFSDLSLWDTFRTQHPWLLLRNEHIALALARSMEDITIQQNAFPRWTLGSHEGSCMIGEHGAAAVLECILSGFGDLINVSAIQSILLKQSTESWPINGRADVEHYLSAGYVSQDAADDSTSLTLSYAYDDYILAMLSEYVGDSDSYESSMQRSKNYRNVWSLTNMYFCPKSIDGTLDCPNTGKSPEAWKEFREGDAYHWSWFVPHDPEGLVGLYNSKQDYQDNLELYFQNHIKSNDIIGSALPNPYYWAGNEHQFLIPWLFNYGTDCTRTQYWTRRLLPMHYSNNFNGIPGNEDYGSMASWLIFNVLGFFPQAGTDKYLIGSPTITEAKIKLHHINNKPITILHVVAYNNSIDNVYIEKLLINGITHTQSWIHKSLLTSTEYTLIEYFMTNQPYSSICNK